VVYVSTERVNGIRSAEVQVYIKEVTDPDVVERVVGISKTILMEGNVW